MIKLDDLSAEIEKRNGKYSAVPIHIVYEWKYTWDMTLIDTPGMIFEGTPSPNTLATPPVTIGLNLLLSSLGTRLLLLLSAALSLVSFTMLLKGL